MGSRLAGMAKSPKPFFAQIRPNLLYDVSKYIAFTVVSLLAATAVFLYRFLRGYPRDLILIGTMFVGAFLLMIVAVAIAKFAKRSEDDIIANDGAGPNRSPAQISEAPSISPCPDTWLHKIATFHEENIHAAVRILDCTLLYKDLDSAAPYVNFNFHILNLSVHSLCIDKAVDGWVDFAARRLGGHLRRTDSSRPFSHGQATYLVITQWLSKEDVAMIDSSSAQCAFSFENLEVTIKGDGRFAEDRTVIKQKLEIRCKVERAGQGYLDDDERAKLRAETESLRSELSKLSGLAFEVDTNQQSQARIRPHQDIAAAFRATHPLYRDAKPTDGLEIDEYILNADLKVQFENHDIHRRGLKQIELSLVRAENGREYLIPFLAQPVMLLMDPDKGMEKKGFPDVVFVEQSIITMWLHFNARVPREHGEKLNGDYFLRLTLHPLGQQAYSQELNVNWEKAAKSGTYITPRAPS